MAVSMGLTVEEAAERLKLSQATVKVLIKRGKLPAVKFGKSWVIQESDLPAVVVRKKGRPLGAKDKRARNRKHT